jgi:hypothetical protein
LTGVAGASPRRWFRKSPRDATVLVAALVQGLVTALLVAALAMSPPPPALAAMAAFLIAIGVWWGSNTISHIHLHAPLFGSRTLNALFSLYLTLLLRIPQTTWRTRHLAHHHPGDRRERPRRHVRTTVELLLIAITAIGSAAIAPDVFVVLALGQMLGLGLCFVQGHYEHRGNAPAIDHHGRLYNQLWFNDGYHLAHHRWPGRHWSTLPAGHLGMVGDPSQRPMQISEWPPILRWIDDVTRGANLVQAAALDWLERRVLRSRVLQRALIAAHRRAFRPLLAHTPAGRVRIGVVGGGLFPRTVLVLRDLLPNARLAIIDSNPRHLQVARDHLGAAGDHIELRPELFQPQGLTSHFDVLVIPLAYRGDRERLYREPPAPITLIHDWVWRRRGHDGRRISWLLLKRVNLVLT